MKKLLALVVALCLVCALGGAMAAPDAPCELPLTTEPVTLSAAVYHDTARVSDLIDNEFTRWMEE